MSCYSPNAVLWFKVWSNLQIFQIFQPFKYRNGNGTVHNCESEVISISPLHNEFVPWFDHRIPLEFGANLVNIRPYGYPLKQRDIIEKLVPLKQNQGIIRTVATPVVLLGKKDGSWRLFVDYKDLTRRQWRINSRFSWWMSWLTSYRVLMYLASWI